MKKLILVLFILYTPFLLADENTLQNLNQFQWKNRVLLLHDPSNPQETLQNLLKLSPQFAERNLLWFLFSNGSLETNYPGNVSSEFASNIKSRFLQGSGTKVVLIGKDGGVKYNASSFSPVEILKKIDSMPMRRQEKQNGEAP
ncbi:DUF4174 domain-containing protein [Microbulbifer epialgicus]|uniref:DUF4174 domain-containing protein n=1 Tax=Microbulbifer epialgicus TaxID=393907 RepID=A0ABV4P0W1_9GAMM